MPKQKAIKYLKENSDLFDGTPRSRCCYEDLIEEAIQIALNEQALKILDKILKESIKNYKDLGILIAGGNLTLIILKDTNLSFLETNPIWYKYYPLKAFSKTQADKKSVS